MAAEPREITIGQSAFAMHPLRRHLHRALDHPEEVLAPNRDRAARYLALPMLRR